MRFMAACGVDMGAESAIHQVDLYTSHEALVLGYEEALTRQDSLTGLWYDCSAHLLWVGMRTRQLDGAHVEFLRGIHNPVGVQDRRPPPTPTTSSALCERLNPDRVPGRLTLVTRMGADRVDDALPPLLPAVEPTRRTRSCGRAIPCTATRSPPTAARPATSTRSSGSSRASSPPTGRPAPGRAASTSSSPARTSPSAWAAPRTVDDVHLDDRYETMCDPRLNARQSLDLAFRVAELLRADPQLDRSSERAGARWSPRR